MADFIKTSDLSERISFQKKKKIKDPFGGFKEDWSDEFQCWACLKEQMLRDMYTLAGTTMEGTVTFIVRYQQVEKIQTDMRIKHNNESYEIISISKGTYSKDFTTIIAKEVD